LSCQVEAIMWDSLIFFERTRVDADGVRTIDIAVAEQEHTAARLEAQGFRRCSYAEFRAAWQARDALAYAQQSRSFSAASQPAPQEVAIDSPHGGARIYSVT
jgi:hypothetical protein